MVIGHLAPALFARTRYPELPVALLLLTTYSPDLCETALALGGMRGASAAQYSHSVPVIAGMLLIFMAAAVSLGASLSATTALALVGLSHLPLDWITGVNKPIFFAFHRTIGFDLYQHTAVDWLVEGSLCALAWWVWSRGRSRTIVTRSAAGLASVLALQAVIISFTASQSLASLSQRALSAAASLNKF